jgi:plasmid stabilization system protein ParE
VASKFEVKWAETAVNDLTAIISFINADSDQNALEVLGKIRKKASTLNNMPKRGRIVPELKEQGINLYRELVVDPWRIIYRISGNTVFVLAALDSRRNMEDILLERFIGR